MVNDYDSCLASCKQLLVQALKEVEAYMPMVNHDEMRVTKTTVQHEIEKKGRELVKMLKEAKAEFEKAKKELDFKKQSVLLHYKSSEQLESRLSRGIKAYESKVKRDKERKALICPVFNFLEEVGFHFNVVHASADIKDPSIFKIGFSNIDAASPEKVFSLKIAVTSEVIKVLETDAADEQLKNLEKTYNESFKTVYLPVFIVRARKIFQKAD